MTGLYAGKRNADILDYLHRRRSVKADNLTGPGPDKTQLDTILRAGLRTPDHGKLAPWYFLVFEGEARADAGRFIADLYARENPEARPDKLESESMRFTKVPVVIGVISRMRPGKIPLWEQILSAGAVCMNMSLAAHASGFGVNWVTEWYAFHPAFKTWLGLDERDHIAGFLQIGSVAAMPEERDRPDLNDRVTYWKPGAQLLKGDQQDQGKFDFPRDGFDFSTLKRNA